VVIPATVKTLDCSRANGALAVELEGGERICAWTVVVASGARYRHPAIADIARFEGRGVWYWASAPLRRRRGRSRGRGQFRWPGRGVSLRPRRQGSKMVRSPGLAESMSRYLIDRIAATSNIEPMTETEIAALTGAPGASLERVRWRDRRAGAEIEAPIRNVFLFVGADPATEWLQGCGVKLDKAGFVVTAGRPVDNEGPARSPLESSVPGVFAVGDVRSGSVKRVGGAIGEGAQVVAAIHNFLSHSPGPHL
jgi:thioredoxin reductase (NADPH)